MAPPTYDNADSPLTVVCWTSPAFAHWSAGLEQDARDLGYAFHRYEVHETFDSAVDASLNHPRIALQATEDYGRVLFCDAECRLTRPIPNWPVPSVAARRPSVPFYLHYNSGTMLLDRSCHNWLRTWIRMLEAARLGDLDRNQYYIRFPGDLCDELALFMALAAHGVRPYELDLQCLDRNKSATVARGYWSNESTVVQHPTLQHWPATRSPLEAKKLFWQNFPGDRSHVDRCMKQESGPHDIDAWHFNPDRQEYFPLIFPGEPRLWMSEAPNLSAEEL